MGADIHTYIEFSDWAAADGQPYWENFTRNGGSRNYTMFGVLAGVRDTEAQLFEPKGMPEGRLGYMTENDYWARVAPDEHPEWAEMDGWTDRERAEEYVRRGYSKAEYDKDGKLYRVSGPDWHSHSWLTADELEQALEHYVKVIEPERTGAPAEWKATLAAMRAFEDAGAKTRLVFWFDN